MLVSLAMRSSALIFALQSHSYFAMLLANGEGLCNANIIPHPHIRMIVTLFFFSVDCSQVLARSWMSSLQETPAVLPSFVSSKARVTRIETFVFSLGSVLHQSCFLSLCFLSIQMSKTLFSFCSISLDLAAIHLLLSAQLPLSAQLVPQVPSGTCSLLPCSEASACTYREGVTKEKQIVIKNRM